MTNQNHGLYEFGPFRLDTARRQFFRGSDPVSLAPKTFDLLLLLLESDGRVLSKKELMTALWPDTFVEEANLSFQMSTLRKALGEEGSAWIETVPKIGYRLAKAGRPTAADVAPMTPAASRRFKLRPAAIGSAAVIVSLCLGFAYWVWQQREHQASPSGTSVTAIPLTAYPGFELNPSLSPDGSQVAFSWNGPNEDNFDIYVKLVGPGEPVRLTQDPTEDTRPAWSPDGRLIAFLRHSEGSAAGLFVIPALGGAERKLADLHMPFLMGVAMGGLNWTPDGKWLAVGGRLREDDIPGIWLVSSENGQRRRLTSALPRSVVGDFGPAFSPDGRLLAFVRAASGPALSDIYVLPMTADFAPRGQTRRLTFENRAVGAPSWTPDGRELVFSIGGHVAPRALKRIAVDLPAGGKSDPQPLPFGEQATTLSISRNGRLVYARQQRDSNIWSVELARPPKQPAAMNQPLRLLASTYHDHTPDYSPDGSRIAFASTRSGSEEIWVANSDGSHPVQLTFMGGPLTANPRWSHDGRTILFNSRKAGNSDLYLLHLDTGSVQRLTDDPSEEGEARWSRDSRWIYFGSNKTGRFEVWKMPAGGGSATQVTRNGGMAAYESSDGRWLYYSKHGESPSSIWKTPVSGGEETKVVDHLSYSPNFVVADRGICFLALQGAGPTAALEFFEFATGKTVSLLKLDKPWWFGLAISPDQRFLLYSVIDQAGSDLMLVENFR